MRLVRRQFVCGETHPSQVLEPWFVVRDWLAESSKSRSQKFDPVKLGARFLECATKLAVDPFNCSVCVCSHTGHAFKG